MGRERPEARSEPATSCRPAGTPRVSLRVVWSPRAGRWRSDRTRCPLHPAGASLGRFGLAGGALISWPEEDEEAEETSQSGFLH